MGLNISPPVRTGLILVAIHSLLAILFFFTVKNTSGVAQAELAWLLLFFPDMPAVFVAYEYFSSLLQAVD